MKTQRNQIQILKKKKKKKGDLIISKIVRICPQVLLSNIENTLLPNFEFFRSKGALSSARDDIVKLFR